MNRFLRLLFVLLIAGVLVQGFQCSNKEITSAKVAIQSNDYAKAKGYLEQAIQKNPKSDEAWMLMSTVKLRMNDFKGAADALLECEKVAVDPKIKQNVTIEIYNFWTRMYQSGVGYYNNFITQKNPALLDTAIYFIDLASIVRPEMLSFYNIRGMSYEAKSNIDTTGLMLTKNPSIIGTTYDLKKYKSLAIENYEQYTKLSEEELGIIKSKGIYKDIPRDDPAITLDKPVNTEGGSLSNGDSTIIDLYKVDGKDLYIFSSRTGMDKFRIRGWRYNPPAKWAEWEKSTWMDFDISPYAALAQIYFESKEYDKALKYVKQITEIEPQNAQAQSFLIELYNVQNKKDEAMKNISELAAKYPDNKLYHAQYGDLLMNSGELDKSIVEYEKALKIDPEFDFVLRNIAAVYKNKAGKIQRKQQEMKEKDKNYVENVDEYAPDLTKSAEYFERARKTPRFQNDIEVLGELINIFEVLDDKAKISNYLGSLQQLEFDDSIDKLNYYKIMCKVYTLLKMADKRKDACDKYIELSK